MDIASLETSQTSSAISKSDSRPNEWHRNDRDDERIIRQFQLHAADLK